MDQSKLYLLLRQILQILTLIAKGMSIYQIQILGTSNNLAKKQVDINLKENAGTFE
jgi:hypothetical protein